MTSSHELSDWDGTINEPEQALIEHVTTGDLLDLEGGPTPLDDQPAIELETMQTWGADRTIRAEVLRHLLVAPRWPVHAKGVRLRGARITGALDLEYVELRCPLVLGDCYFDSELPLALDHATMSLLRLVRCQMAGLTADSVVVTKELDLNRSSFTGAVILLGADITGQLNCSGAQIAGTDRRGNALIADGVKVGGDMLLNDGFIADGAVRLPGAVIAGQFVCSGAHITGTDADADADADNDALVAEGVKVGEAMFLNDGFTANGALQLSVADITGSLVCSGAKITGTDADNNALVAVGVKVAGSILLNDGFVADGAVRLPGAVISGQFVCSGAHITGTDTNNIALLADGVKVGNAIFLNNGFVADGAVRLPGAVIAGQFVCSGAHITGTDADNDALVADGVKVGGTIFLNNGFTSAGTVRLTGARVDGALSLQQATLADPVALEAQGAKIGQRLLWAPKKAVTGLVNLDRVQVNRLDDDWSKEGAYWPAAGNLRLAGFVYDGFGGKHLATCQQRLDWVRSQHRKPQPDKPARFGAQPYEQLARVYRQMGHESDARRVAIARQNDLRTYSDMGRLRRAGNRLLDVTIKHGYQPLRAVGALFVVFVAAFVLAYGAQHRDHVMVPTKDPTSARPATTAPTTPTAMGSTAQYPSFYPLGYAIDLTIPIVKVGQADYWRINGAADWGWAFAGGTWIITGLGWALTTLAVVGYTGLVRKD